MSEQSRTLHKSMFGYCFAFNQPKMKSAPQENDPTCQESYTKSKSKVTFLNIFTGGCEHERQAVLAQVDLSCSLDCRRQCHQNTKLCCVTQAFQLQVLCLQPGTIKSVDFTQPWCCQARLAMYSGPRCRDIERNVACREKRRAHWKGIYRHKTSALS